MCGYHFGSVLLHIKVIKMASSLLPYKASHKNSPTTDHCRTTPTGCGSGCPSPPSFSCWGYVEFFLASTVGTHTAISDYCARDELEDEQAALVTSIRVCDGRLYWYLSSDCFRLDLSYVGLCLVLFYLLIDFTVWQPDWMRRKYFGTHINITVSVASLLL